MLRLARRPLVLAAAAGVVIIGAGSYGLVQAAASTDHRASPAHRFVDRRFGWTIQVPIGLLVQRIRPRRIESHASEGVRITNFSPRLSADDRSSPPMQWLRRFPADGVGLQIWWLDDPVGVPWASRPSTLPLTRGSFQPSRPYVGGSEPHPFYRPFFIAGFGLAAALWVGPRSSRGDRQALWRIVRSLHFPRLRAGTVWQHAWYVLGPASRYQNRSVILFPRSSFPRDKRLFWRPGGFYLVHSTHHPQRFGHLYVGPFYGIEQVFVSPERFHSKCKVSFDAKDAQFFCPGTDLRWDETGEPIAAHAGNENWTLGALPVTHTQDGNLLIEP
jgi:hypothetical protein